MAQTSKQRIGRWGETVATYFLEQRGYRVLARNVRTGRGEIDLITRQDGERQDSKRLDSKGLDSKRQDSKRQDTLQGSVLVFVEVKTRTNEHFGLPEEAVDARKLEHVFRAAEAYLQEHTELVDQEWRIDVIAIQGRPGDRAEDVRIEHFENISA